MPLGSGRIIYLILALLLITPGCTLVEVNLISKPSPLTETELSGEGRAKVVLIGLSGLLVEEPISSPILPFGGSESPLARLTEELDKAAEDDEVKGIVLKINSPGGTTSASDLIYHQLRRHAEKTGQKVVACLMGLAASGGYYVSLAADRIVAIPTGITGSIGVISLKFDLAGLMAKHGVKAEAIKSGPHKDMWSLFRPSTEEERAIIKDLIQDQFERFKGLVRERRSGVGEKELIEATSGRVMPASRALELGLIDKLGYPEEAFEAVKELAGLKKARLVLYHRPGAHRPNLYAQTGADSGSGNNLMNLAGSPRLYYLWLPGVR